jgi:phenylalanyl-tRNA synthetase alpha chain
VPPSVMAKIGAQLHTRPQHPLFYVRNRIQRFFPTAQVFDQLHPKVSVKQCFDDLLVTPDHVSRQPSDTFYVDEQHVLRTHTSAHQTELLRKGIHHFLVFGDCYRRDEIDRTHYPVFHQVEGVRVWNKEMTSKEAVIHDLKSSLEGMVKHMFNQQALQIRWVDAYFPFTDPSFEMEIYFNGDWLEVLGCGLIQQKILDSCQPDRIGWAFGIGLERIAMALYGIPDIRLFWSEDERFLSQFRNLGEEIIQFKPFSKYPGCHKDISFWLPAEGNFHENDLFASIREVAGDLVESVEMIDEFEHPKTGKRSKCYRIMYRSMERSLVNEEIDDLQHQVRENLTNDLRLELR